MSVEIRDSAALSKAELRLTSLKTIDPNLDLGDGVSAAELIAKIESTRQALQERNSTVTLLKQLARTLRSQETDLEELNQRIENGVASKYGKKSDQYYMLTGKSPNPRKSSKRSESAPENSESNSDRTSES